MRHDAYAAHAAVGGSSSRRVQSSFGLKIKRALIVMLLLLMLGGGGLGAYFLFDKYGGTSGSSSGTQQAKGTESGGSTATTSGDGFNKGTGKEDPLAYVPAEASVVIGLNGAAGNPLLKTLLDQGLTQLGLTKTVADCKKETGQDFKELFDTTIIALKMPVAPDAKPEGATLILKSSAAFDQKKLGQWASDKPAQKLKDKFYFEKHKDASQFATVFMPSDRIVVLTAAKADAVVANDGSKPALAADSVTAIRKMEKSPFWVWTALDAKAKEEIKAGKGLGVLPIGLPAEAQPIVGKVIADAKGVGIWGSVDGDKVNLSIGLACANDAAATEVVNGLQAAWTKNKDNMTKGLAGAKDVPADTLALLKDVAGSLQIAKQDNVATVSVKLAAGPLDKVAKEGFASLQKKSGTLVAQATKLAPAAEVVEKGFDMSPEEKRLLEIVNGYRKNKDKKPLKADSKLFEVARAYAKVLAKENKQDDELDGKDTPKRVKDGGYKVLKKGGEEMVTANITGGANFSPDTALQVWSQNAAANENLLDNYEEAGIGVAKQENIVYLYLIVAIPDK
jgi:uncharacterized protein YkwD